MRLLIITQKVDVKDSILGFFHEWIEKMAERVERVFVVCLYEGEHHLPENVTVLSLGKEEGESRIKYLFNLYKYFFSLIGKIDLIFVHMNTVYVVLLGAFAKLFGIPIIHWKVHRGEIPWFEQAIFFSDKIATASQESIDYDTPKKQVVGHGINTEMFHPSSEVVTFDKRILALGRVSPSKKYEVLVRAADVLFHQRGIKDMKVKIVGGASSDRQREYLRSLKKEVKSRKLEEVVDFVGPVPHEETVHYYQESDIFVNFCNTTGLDKTLLEAMACGTLICTSQDLIVPFLGDYKKSFFVKEGDFKAAASKMEAILSWPLEKKRRVGRDLREIVIKNHSLSNLVSNLLSVFKETIYAKSREGS